MGIRSSLETKIPPPVYGLLTALCIWLIAKLLPSLSILPPLSQKIGIVLIVIGVGIDISALRQFFKKRTSPNPLSPQKASAMVISGLYRFTRNPMYLGLLLSLTGWAIYNGNLASFACLPVFVWVINQMQILPEERILKDKFGTSYLQYLNRVRRWI